MSSGLGGCRAWIRMALGSPKSSFLVFKIIVSRGQRYTHRDGRERERERNKERK